MKSGVSKTVFAAVAVYVVFSLCTLQLLHGNGRGEAPEDRKLDKIDRFQLSDTVKFKAHVELGIDRSKYKIDFRSGSIKNEAKANLKIGTRTLKPILDIQIDIKDPAGNTFAIHDLRRKPLIEVFITLSSQNKSLFFWEPQLGRWVLARRYESDAFPDTKIANYNQTGRRVYFIIVKWPKDDKNCSEG